jgi:hypothetical protein
LGLPTVNESGTVAFGAIRDDGTRALYTAPVGGGTLTLLYDSTGSFSTVGTGGLFGNINNRGTVLFRGELDAGGEGLFLGNGGPVTRVADTSGAYGALFYGRINAAGQTAFRAALDGGGEGIFFGADPATDKVIAAGDVLFGSTVAGIENLGGLNDAGQLVFEYTLANGISGVALATPVPEPTTAGAIVLGALVTAARRRRATSHQPGLVRRDV